MPTLSKKICLIGDFNVGKTSLIRCYVDRQFTDQYLSTVGVKISRKLVDLPTAGSVQLLIWDIEGMTRFKDIAANYLQGAKGAIVVGDLTRPETVDGLATHMQRFLAINPSSWVIVALNKADLVDAEKQDRQRRSLLLPQSGRVLSIHTTSAKTGTQVDLIFHTLATRILEPE